MIEKIFFYFGVFCFVSIIIILISSQFSKRRFLNFFLKVYAGKSLSRSTEKLIEDFPKGINEKTSSDFLYSLVNRFTRVFTISLILSLVSIALPYYFLYKQNGLIDQQNRLFESQNEIISLSYKNDTIQTKSLADQNRIVSLQNDLLERQLSKIDDELLLMEIENDLFQSQNSLSVSEIELMKKQFDIAELQRKLLEDQNNLMNIQNEIYNKQSEQQEKISKRSSYVSILNELYNSINEDLRKNDTPSTESCVLSNFMASRIASTTQFISPYDNLEGDVNGPKYSEEKSQLLLYLASLNLDQESLSKISSKTFFANIDLSNRRQSNRLNFSTLTIYGDFSKSYFRNSSFDFTTFGIGFKLSDFKAFNCSFQKTTFFDVDMSRSNFSFNGNTWRRIDDGQNIYTDYELPSNFDSIYISGCVLESTDFRGVKMTNSFISNSNLSKANFGPIAYFYVDNDEDFLNLDIQSEFDANYKFEGTNLSGTRFSRCNLENTIFSKANLSECTFIECTNLTYSQLASAESLKNAKGIPEEILNRLLSSKPELFE